MQRGKDNPSDSGFRSLSRKESCTAPSHQSFSDEQCSSSHRLQTFNRQQSIHSFINMYFRIPTPCCYSQGAQTPAQFTTHRVFITMQHKHRSDSCRLINKWCTNKWQSQSQPVYSVAYCTFIENVPIVLQRKAKKRSNHILLCTEAYRLKRD